MADSTTIDTIWDTIITKIEADTTITGIIPAGNIVDYEEFIDLTNDRAAMSIEYIGRVPSEYTSSSQEHRLQFRILYQTKILSPQLCREQIVTIDGRLRELFDNEGATVTVAGGDDTDFVSSRRVGTKAAGPKKIQRAWESVINVRKYM